MKSLTKIINTMINIINGKDGLMISLKDHVSNLQDLHEEIDKKSYIEALKKALVSILTEKSVYYNLCKHKEKGDNVLIYTKEDESNLLLKDWKQEGYSFRKKCKLEVSKLEEFINIFNNIEETQQALPEEVTEPETPVAEAMPEEVVSRDDGQTDEEVTLITEVSEEVTSEAVASEAEADSSVEEVTSEETVQEDVESESGDMHIEDKEADAITEVSELSQEEEGQETVKLEAPESKTISKEATETSNSLKKQASTPLLPIDCSDIQATDQRVELVRSTDNDKDKDKDIDIDEKWSIYMQLLYNGTTGVTENCRLYMVKDKMPMIDSDGGVMLSKERILSANDHSVMNILKRFVVNTTEDQRKKAFERAKYFLENNARNAVDVGVTMSIDVAYKELVKEALATRQKEIGDKELPDKQKKLVKHEDENCLYIKAVHLQEMLDDLNCGYTQTIFCKKVLMLQSHLGETLMLTNPSRQGYGVNTAGNERCYVFTLDNTLAKQAVEERELSKKLAQQQNEREEG